MVEATNPRRAVQEIKMDYESVSQVSMEVSMTQTDLTTSVCAFIDAEQDSEEYVNLLSDLYDAGFEVSDKGKVDTGRRMVKGTHN